VMQPIIINGEPYLYAQQHKHKALYTSVHHEGLTVVQPSEYVLLDRHFNALILSEKQMEYYIRDHYAKFKRTPTTQPKTKGKHEPK
jgi:hypothetical protein